MWNRETDLASCARENFRYNEGRNRVGGSSLHYMFVVLLHNKGLNRRLEIRGVLRGSMHFHPDGFG